MLGDETYVCKKCGQRFILPEFTPEAQRPEFYISLYTHMVEQHGHTGPRHQFIHILYYDPEPTDYYPPIQGPQQQQGGGSGS